MKSGLSVTVFRISSWKVGKDCNYRIFFRKFPQMAKTQRPKPTCSYSTRKMIIVHQSKVAVKSELLHLCFKIPGTCISNLNFYRNQVCEFNSKETHLLHKSNFWWKNFDSFSGFQKKSSINPIALPKSDPTWRIKDADQKAEAWDFRTPPVL